MRPAREEADMEPNDDIGRRLKAAKMVAVAIIASMVVYLALVEVLKAAAEPFRGFVTVADMQPVRYAVFGAAAAVILLILVLRPRLFRRRDGESLAAALMRLQRAALLTMVLAEAPAIFGLVLFLIGGSAADFYKLLFASLVLAFIHFPRRGAWEEWLKG
jgi:hypothetical protein